MAKKSLVIEILGNNKLGRAVAGAMGSLRSLGRFARSVGRGIATAFKFAAAGVATMVAGLAYASKVYGVQEQADIDLAAAIRKRGGEVEKLLPLLKAEASAIQLETKHGDEFVQSLQAQAINMGIAAEGATEATKAAMGLAKAYGLELISAMRLVTRARVGDTSTLKRYGIVLDDTMSAEDKYNAMLRIGAGNYSLVQEEVRTLSGRFAQFKNVIGDVVEAFGGAFVEGTDLKGVFEQMSRRAAEFGAELQQRLIPHFQRFREIVDGLMAGGGDRAKAIQDIKDNFSKAMDVVGPVLVSWGEAAGAAIWRGFKRGGAAVATGVGERAAEAGRSSKLRFTPIGQGLSAVQDLSAIAGGVAGGSGIRGRFQGGMRVAQELSQRNRGGGTKDDPIYVQEVNPISGVETR